MKPKVSLFVCTLCLVLAWTPVGCGKGSTPSPERSPDPEREPSSPEPQNYTAEIRQWQEERERSLQRPEGWLALVGLFWLDDGANTFGGAPDNDLVFPPSPGGNPPDHAGTFYLEDGTVRLEAEPGADLRTEPGEPVTETVMVPDTREGTTRIALGSFRFWVIERGGELGVRLVDRQSPALESFEGLEYFPVDPRWRIEARLEREEGLTVAVPNVLGQVAEQPSPGVLVFEMPGGVGAEAERELRLLPMAAGDELFIVFGDETNGDGTYGGGRFLYADAPADGETRVVLDFNRAYNPPCAFTAYATCPLPPRPNKLPVPIPAGEKAYAGGPAH